MEIYKIWALVGFVFLFIEIMTPSMFFLPLGGAAFFAAIAAFKYPDNYWIQGGMFALFAVLFYITARPFMRKKETGDEQTGVDAKYIENEALVLKDIGVKNTDGIGSSVSKTLTALVQLKSTAKFGRQNQLTEKKLKKAK